MTAHAGDYEAATDSPEWGSDVVARFLRQTGMPYVALNPGASFRGLHDSLVNYLHDQDPRMLVCLHEEHAVALAHGYAKVTGEPLAVALHSNVGLMHASMAIYNAWVDRVPVFLVGATGPVDAAKRRPWIDWIHTASDQAALVRPYVKWDDQPMSVEATVESLARAWEIVRTPPHAPTYVVLDAEVQEQALARPVPLPPAGGSRVADVPAATAESLRRAAELLRKASRPVVLMGRVSRDVAAWERRVRLVELLGARVVTDLKAGAAFPSRHEAHVPGPGFFLSSAGREALAAADVVLALDWVDLAGTMKQAPATGERRTVSVTLDPQLHNGWSKDHQGYLPVDVTLPTLPDTAVDQLLDLMEQRQARARPRTQPPTPDEDSEGEVSEDHMADARPIELPVLARLLRRALHGTDVCLVRLPLGWDGDDWPFDHPLDYLGYDGGGGIGSGPGMLVGAALALRGSGRLPVAVLGDGDYLMGVQGLWTAAHERIPLLAVVANNRSYFNDEVHQERVARVRDRDVSRRWVGQRIDDPAPDLAALARAQGLEGIGPVGTVEELAKALPAAVALVREGKPVVVDVVVEPGYTPSMSSGLTRTG